MNTVEGYGISDESLGNGAVLYVTQTSVNYLVICRIVALYNITAEELITSP